MKTRRWATLLLALITAGSLAAADEPTGAKELFGGGLDRTVVQFSETTTDPPAPPPQKDPKSGKHSTKRRTLPFGLSCWIELVENRLEPGLCVSMARR